jgi:hypothetical protein
MNPAMRAAIVLAVCAACAYAAWRIVVPPSPVPIATAHGPVSGAAWKDGAWYWLEAAGTPGARVMRVGGSRSGAVAAAAGITEFAVGDGRVAWIGGSGKNWSIGAAPLDGGAASAIWNGEQQPRGVCIAERRIYWLEQRPPPVPDSGPFPPLDSTVAVMSAPLDGGSATSIGTILEPMGGRVLGVHDSQIYVTTSRAKLHDVTADYRLPSGGGAAHRIAAGVGRQDALLSSTGTLYWTAPSPEASQPQRALCVRRLLRDGKIETLDDWLPTGGTLYETGQGIIYVDSSWSATAWPIGSGRGLAHAVPPPANFAVAAAGADGLLLRRTDAAKDVTLYRIPLP